MKEINIKKQNQKYRRMWSSFSCFVVMAVILYLVTINNSKADEDQWTNQKVGKVALVTRDNFQEISFKLQNDDPLITSLTMEFAATENELEMLHESLKNNKELGHISWHINQTRWESLQKIEVKLIENNQNYKDFPSDYIHGLLSLHVYHDSQEADSVIVNDLVLNDDIRQQLNDWHVVDVYNNNKESGYYGVIYKNDKTHQIVLANRGTESKAIDLLTNIVMLGDEDDWNTNAREILIGCILIHQQARNYQATAKAVALAKKLGYRLSFTGHSLGAWLSELSAFYSHAYFNFHNIKAVTFESPGALPMMEKLQSNIKSKETQVNLENIDVVTYLALPNPANSCNSHVGKIYQVEPKMEWTSKVNEKLPDYIKNTLGNVIQGFLAIEGHILMEILETFDSTTGKPKKYKTMADWPRIQYEGTPRDFLNAKASILKNIMNGNIPSVLADIVGIIGTKAINYMVGDTTLMAVIDLVLNFGSINQEQYWAYVKYINSDEDNREPLGDELHEKLIANRKFALVAKAKYREGTNNAIMKLVKGTVDDYLYDLYENKDKLEQYGSQFLIETQLEKLVSFFSIESIGLEYSLIPNEEYDVEMIRQRAQRLLQVLPKNLQKPWQQSEISGICELELQLLDNLPLGVAYYINIQDKEDELKERLKKDQIVLISGLGGMGKSTLAAKYGRDRKQEGVKVRWIKGTQIEEEFLRLAEELNLNTENQNLEMIQNLVYAHFDNFSKKQPILLIFDNVETVEQIEKFLINLPRHVKVIITSRE